MAYEPAGRTERLDLSSLLHLPMTEAAERQVVDAWAARGQHRTPIPDLISAAIAHTNSAVVLHYDSDYERIAAVTGQGHEWILPQGAGHGAGSLT